jgi:hypothetical protein
MAQILQLFKAVARKISAACTAIMKVYEGACFPQKGREGKQGRKLSRDNPPPLVLPRGILCTDDVSSSLAQLRGSS